MSLKTKSNREKKSKSQQTCESQHQPSEHFFQAVKPPRSQYTPPPSNPQAAKPLPDLRFLKRATSSTLLLNSQSQLASIREAALWHAAMDHLLQARASLSRQLHEGLMKIVEAIGQLEESKEAGRGEDLLYENLEGPGQVSPGARVAAGITEQHSESKGSTAPGTAPATGESVTGKSIPNVGFDDQSPEIHHEHEDVQRQSFLAEVEADAEAAIRSVRILRARWNAGGRMFENWAGQRQGMHFRDNENSTTAATGVKSNLGKG